jgi:hypothetical protein
MLVESTNIQTDYQIRLIAKIPLLEQVTYRRRGRPRQLPLLADAIEDFYSPSASKGSCWRPRQLPLLADAIEG